MPGGYAVEIIFPWGTGGNIERRIIFYIFSLVTWRKHIQEYLEKHWIVLKFCGPSRMKGVLRGGIWAARSCIKDQSQMMIHVWKMSEF